MDKIGRASANGYRISRLSEISSPESRSLIVLAQSVTLRWLVITLGVRTWNAVLAEIREPFCPANTVFSPGDTRACIPVTSKHPMLQENRKGNPGSTVRRSLTLRPFQKGGEINSGDLRPPPRGER